MKIKLLIFNFKFDLEEIEDCIFEHVRVVGSYIRADRNIRIDDDAHHALKTLLLFCD